MYFFYFSYTILRIHIHSPYLEAIYDIILSGRYLYYEEILEVQPHL